MSESKNNNEDIIYMETVTAPNNIACIKYWGKADVKWNTPINSSVSVTLDQADLRAVTTVAVSRSFTEHRLWLNGKEEVPNRRFHACIDGVKALAQDLIIDSKVVISKDEWPNLFIHVSSYNSFPTAAGMASSAAGYAALVAALAQLLRAKEQFTNQLSTIARQGSGSACRSLYGGFVAWRQGNDDDVNTSVAQQVATEDHWPELRALVLVVNDKQKETSSTAGMQTSVATSQLLKHRAQNIVPMWLKQIEEAYLNRDFQTFAQITMKDSNQLHAVCLDTYPPIVYMNDVSHAIVSLVHAYNAWSGDTRATYTFDAGPNAVLFALEQNVIQLSALVMHYFGVIPVVDKPDFQAKVLAHTLDPTLLEATAKFKNNPNMNAIKMIYYTKSGPGPQRLVDGPHNLDPKTGLNTFLPPTK